MLILGLCGVLPASLASDAARASQSLTSAATPQSALDAMPQTKTSYSTQPDVEERHDLRRCEQNKGVRDIIRRASKVYLILFSFKRNENGSTCHRSALHFVPPQRNAPGINNVSDPFVSLSFVSAVVLKVTLAVAEGLWASNVINGLMGTTSEGLTTQSMEQGGIGLLMTLLIISAPPMAAQFFNGTLGSFMAYSAFSGGGSRPGPQGQPAGSYAGSGGYRPAPQGSVAPGTSPMQSSGGFNDPGLAQARQVAATDPGVRTNPQFANAPTSPPSAGS